MIGENVIEMVPVEYEWYLTYSICSSFGLPEEVCPLNKENECKDSPEGGCHNKGQKIDNPQGVCYNAQIEDGSIFAHKEIIPNL